MTSTLSGKVAIVTGGNSGIGAATVLRLAQDGARVAILARREAEGHAVEQAVRAAGGTACFIACDVTDAAAVTAAVAQTVAAFGAINVLFNNAGGAPKPDPFPAPGDEAAWEETLRLNLTSAYLITQAVWPHLLAAGGGSIINMSSTAAVVGISVHARSLVPALPPVAYWAAKAGVEALTRFTASSGAPHNIRANAVRPGLILTPGTTPFTPGRSRLEPLFAEWQLTEGPGYPEDVAHLVAFLASDESRFINAQVLNIDGGAADKV